MSPSKTKKMPGDRLRRVITAAPLVNLCQARLHDWLHGVYEQLSDVLMKHAKKRLKFCDWVFACSFFDHLCNIGRQLFDEIQLRHDLVDIEEVRKLEEVGSDFIVLVRCDGLGHDPIPLQHPFLQLIDLR